MERRPQDWIALALQGFFADEGRTMCGAMKGALAGKLALACAGIQGEVEVAPFERLLTDAGSPQSLRQLSPVPGGYSKLPSGIVCKCYKMRRDKNGDHWCCLPPSGTQASEVEG